MNRKTDKVNISRNSTPNIVIYFIFSIAWKNQSGYRICPGISKYVKKMINAFSLNFGMVRTNIISTKRLNSANKHLAHSTFENIVDTISGLSLFLATSRVAV